MRHRIATTLAIALLLAAPVALAQSPAPSSRTVENPSHIPGSGQGGYLGQNPGPQIYPQQSAVSPARPAQSSPDEMMAWCANSPEPSRCRSRAAAEHEICTGKTPDSYARCRAAMDQMHGP